jgi:hypothetical protein
VQYAWSIVFHRVAVRDVKIGDLLGRRSRALQAAIVAGYGDTFRLLRPYACKSHGVCVGEFAPVGGPLHLTFGTYPKLGNWLSVWQKPPGA